MFPDREGTELTDILCHCDGDTTAAAEFLLASVAAPKVSSERNADQPGPSSSGVSLTIDELSVSGILQVHASNMMSDCFFELLVKRERLWRSALFFYKNCIHNPERVLYDLRIEFENEEGVDAGALRCEFFECLLREMNEKLFEGEPTRRVPKRDSNIDKNFQSVGMMIGHSVMQGGPSFPCLCPAVYSFLLFGDKELALQELPSVNDIPQNAATAGIIDLIREVSCLCSR